MALRVDIDRLLDELRQILAACSRMNCRAVARSLSR